MNEPDSFSVNPIPATAGAGNPVDVPAGEKVPPPKKVTSNSIYSSVTTSQDDYEKAGTSLPIIGGALAGAGLGAAGLALSSEKNENLIPESSLPMGPGAGIGFEGAGPFVSSSGPTSTTADLAGQVPLEERKAAEVVDPQSTTSTVPEVVKESIAQAHTDPEATTSAEAVREKSEVEQELLKKIPTAEEAGEPAPTMAAATSETAPSATGPSNGAAPGTSSVAAAAIADGTDGTATPSEAPKTTAPVEKTEGDNTEYAPPVTAAGAPGVSGSAAAAVSDGTEDPTLADEPAVRMMNQNEAETSVPTEAEPVATSSTPAKTEAPIASAPESKKEVAAAPSSVSSTPTKKPAGTPTASPASASKEKKKKNRFSSIFKKIFD